MKDLVLIFIGAALGGLISWWRTYTYYKKSNREQARLYKKLSINLRKWILEDTRTNLSVVDLNELLKKRTIDPESDYSFPYKVCPKCGSRNIVRDDDMQVDSDFCDGEMLYSPSYFKALFCEDCGWRVSEAG